MGHLHGKQWRVPETNKKSRIVDIGIVIRPVLSTLPGPEPDSY